MAARQRTDLVSLRLVDAHREELLELPLFLVEDPECGVARAGELPRDVEHPVENVRQVELGDQRASDFDEPREPLAIQATRVRAPKSPRPA